MARLPRAVEEQGKRADELLKQFGVTQNPPVAAPTPTPGITDPNAAPQPNPQPAPDDPNQYVNPDQPDSAVQPAPQEPVTPQTPQPAPQPCAECEKNKQRYTTLQGKYDAEVPRLTYRIQYLENQIADLSAQAVRAVDTKPATVTVTAPATPAPSVFSEALKSSENPAIKNFKENFPDVFGPLTQILDDFGNQITKKSDEKIASIEKTNADTKQEVFSKAIANAHPDWQIVCQGDPRWAIWLNKTDPYGLSKLMALRSASAKFDPQVVINLLSDFKKEMAVASAQPVIPAQDPRLSQVAPGSGPQGSGTVIGAGDKGPEPVARSFIQKFAQDVTTGKYRGKEAEMNAIQAKIDAAVSAGKILNK
jgi:hypothetical protein